MTGPTKSRPDLRDRIEFGFERWGYLVFRFRWLVILATAALTFVLASGMAALRFESSTDRFLDANDPARVTYDDFRRQFVNDDTVVILLSGQEVLSFPFLERLRALHEDLEADVPLVDEVTSLVNARVTRGSGDRLIVEELLEQWPTDQAELALIAARARANPVYTNTLLSEDERFTTITLSLTPSGGESEAEALAGFDDESLSASSEEGLALPPVLMDEDLDRVMTSLFAVVDRHAGPDFPIWVTGNPEITYSLTQTGRASAMRFAGIAALSISFILAIFFRRISGVALPLVVVTLPLLATLGIMGLIELPLTPSTQNIPSFLLAVCIGDSVHILTIFYQRFDGGVDRREAVAQALAHSGLAVVMTSLTTAVGLGSFLFADLTPLAELGIAAPTGVMLALFYSVVLLPALIAVLPLRRRRTSGSGGPRATARLLASLGALASRHPWPVVAGWSIVVAGSIWGASQLQIAHRPLEWFPEGHRTRVSAETANRAFGGYMPLEVVVDTGRENGLHEPEVMNRLERIQRFARQLHVNGIDVGQAISLVDILKETHQALNGNDPASYAVPQDRELIAQELLLFENSGSDDLEELVDSQFRKARVRLIVTYEDGFLYLGLVQAVRAGAQEIAGELASIETTGLVELWLRTFDAMLSSTFKSYSIALLVIAPLMILLIGSVRLGLLSLIPNLAAITMGMALMATLGIHFDMFTMMIGTIVIGIAVDDTIHFMHGFRRRYRETGDAPDAVQDTLLSTGRALFVTSMVLSCGFFVQLFGTLTGTKNVGLITGCTILAALLANLLLSPALVTLAARYEERQSP